MNNIFLGSPFLFHVEAIDSGYVTAYGPGLSHGVVYEQAVFTINTKNAGAGTCAVSVILTVLLLHFLYECLYCWALCEKVS